MAHTGVNILTSFHIDGVAVNLLIHLVVLVTIQLAVTVTVSNELHEHDPSGLYASLIGISFLTTHVCARAMS